jgi:hypothetical protein
MAGFHASAAAGAGFKVVFYRLGEFAAEEFQQFRLGMAVHGR